MQHALGYIGSEHAIDRNVHCHDIKLHPGLHSGADTKVRIVNGKNRGDRLKNNAESFAGYKLLLTRQATQRRNPILAEEGNSNVPRHVDSSHHGT